MALPQADLPELKRFTFFVSRRFEEGRERFRLHMGFFETQAEAENWLGLVREIYPGAWSGEAPGKKLRARAVAAQAAQAAQATGPHSVMPEPAASAPEPAPRAPQTPARTPTAEATQSVPTLQPAQAPAAAAPQPPRRDGSAAATGREPARRAEAAARKSVPPRQAPPSRPSAAPTAGRTPREALFDNSNIKEVLASLDEPAQRTTGARAAPTPGRAGARSPAPRTLTDAQALQCLEAGGQEELKPVAFAVQLQWSVQPIAFDKLPPLAIFSAYTLYCVEGSREGRKWFGLRLGFFNDAISAKQVAAYVRSEFGSAAVVPVSAGERQRVSGEKPAISLHAPRKASPSEDNEFKLFDSDGPAPAAGGGQKPAKTAAVRELRPIPFETRATGGGKKVHARERRAPQTLEETLEILGAHELTIDDGKGGSSGRSGSGQSRKAERSTPFTKLLERLGERVRKS